MTLRDILVQIDPSAANGQRLDLAIDLAKRHDAHLTGLYVFDVELAPAARFGSVDNQDAFWTLKYLGRLRDDAVEIGAKLEANFLERLRAEGVGGEWRMVEDRAPRTVGMHARYADLAILGQEDPDDARVRGWTKVVEEVLLTSGRPILLVPYAGQFSTVGHRVLVGWNAGREAARAVHDAFPLLGNAESVTVLAVGLDGNDGEPATDLSRHLARHGLPMTADETVSGGLDPADILLNYAADRAIDLIVVGGYGHTRLREIVLGGVTHDLLQRMTVPVLMSH